MRSLAPPWPALDDAAGRLTLRDGTVAAVRRAVPADRRAIAGFFAALSPESRRRRLFASGAAPASVVDDLVAPIDESDGLTLVVERAHDTEREVVAVASYARTRGDAAEVAFAVADEFHGKGVGTALLEQLAVTASSHGIRAFEASTMTENAEMLQVFRDSGFEVESRSAGGCVDIRIILTRSARVAAAEEERRRIATVASLQPLLRPASVAVVGASREPASIGRRVLDAIIAAGFGGAIYPVNPRATEISGLRAIPSARQLPAGVDLAIVTVPAERVDEIVDDCATAGVKSLVVISAGFAEAGPAGRALQKALVERVRLHGMRMVGPNCMGLLNASQNVNLNASFSPVFPPAGRVGLLSQSGALGIAIIRLAAERQLGLSTFVSVGNKADVSGNDLLEYWEADPDTHVILLYLESFGNPRRFARLAKRIGRSKPIVAIKAGRSRAGSRAAASHTAALAASDAVVDALFHQSGVIRTETLDEMFDVAACLDLQPLPAGRRVAVVTNAGGPAILAADACEAGGLSLPEFSPETRARLAAVLPPMASAANPVDMIASAGPAQYAAVMATILDAPDVDALLVLHTPVDTGSEQPVVDAIAGAVGDARRAGVSKTVVACLLSGGEYPRPIPVSGGTGERLPAYRFPENAARALVQAARYADWRRRDAGVLCDFDNLDIEAARTLCRTALEHASDAWLDAAAVHRLLMAFGLPTIEQREVRSADEAVAAANEFGFPVAAKLSSTAIQHKSEVGGVRLGLTDETAVREAFTDILSRARRAAPDDTSASVLIQRMAAHGVETLMGVTHDPHFGALIAFGLGGVDVEILGDVQFRIAPLSDRDADEMLAGIRGARLLAGYRGRPVADAASLREMLLRLSRLAEELPEIVELDLNPVVALPAGSGCQIVDARIRVARPA